MERIKQWHEQNNFKRMAMRVLALIMALNMLLVMLPAAEIGGIVNAAGTALSAEEIAALGEPQITMTTELPVGSKMKLMFDAESVFIDWGDGNVVAYSSDGVTKGNNISIYSEEPITSFECQGNMLTELDVTNCAELVYFTCDNNLLTELDLSTLAELHMLTCGNNQLTSLDISVNSKIYDVFCSYNAISELDISNNPELISIPCEHNLLRFSTMSKEIATVKVGSEDSPYAPQAAIELPHTVSANTGIDLSSEYNIDGTITVYTWYDSDGNAITPTTSENGVFIFDNSFAGKILHCEMTNVLFPELTLTTTNVTVESTIPAEPQITMTTELPVGSSMNLSIIADDTIYIDWGDGNIVEWTKDGVTAGSVIRIYSAENIVDFNCTNNSLTALDISNCNGLMYLSCISNNISTLDVSNNLSLISMDCASNNLSSLDISNNIALETLHCNHNNISTLDVSNNTALAELECHNNSISSLDLSKCSALWVLSCGSNELAELDVSNNTALSYFTCGENNLSELDVSKNTALKLLVCLSNELTELDVSKNTLLEHLECGSNKLAELDVSSNTALTVLHCNANDLTELDVSNNTNLTHLNCAENNLGTLDISNNKALEYFVCSGNDLTEIDIYNNVLLTFIECAENNLSELDISGNPELGWLDCHDNQLTELDTTSNAELYYLHCAINNLSEIDVSKNEVLNVLECRENQITELNISSNTALTELNCGWNLLTTLDVSNNADLDSVHCQWNNLKFSTIPVKVAKLRNYSYADQNQIEIPAAISANDSIDLSSEYNIDGTITVYTWYDADGNVVTPTTAENGVFTFDNSFAGKSLHCEMTNALFPQLTLDTTNVTVVYAEIHATSIELDSANLSMSVGDEVTVNAIVAPADSIDTVVWTSSDDAVAKVDENGNITAVGAGTATITVTAGAVSDSCTVTVNNDGDIIVDDSTGEDVIVDVETEDDFTCIDENGDLIDVRGIKLIVSNVEDNNKKTVKEAIENYNSFFDADQNHYAMYDISLVDKKTHTEVDIETGKIKVAIHVPDNLAASNKGYAFKLYHYREDGTVEEIPIGFNNGNSFFYFYADDFSPYVLVRFDTTKCKNHVYDDKVDGTCNACGIHRENTEKRTVMNMFRMYDPNSGEHFYTGSEVERDNLVAEGWCYEGVGFTFSMTTGAPVYRLYDPVTGEHLYTMDEEEKAMLLDAGWNYEGVAFNSAYDTEVPQYRLHNPNETRGAYHFTSSIEERDFLLSIGWEDQGIGFYSSWK